MKTKNLTLALLGLALLTQACGSATTTTATGTAGQVTTSIQSANGDPVAGATVWIPSSSSVSATKLIVHNKNITGSDGTTTCDDPPEAASDSDCSAANGAVTLSCTGTGSTTVKYAKGSFSGTATISCGAAATTSSFAAASVANFAVVTGSYDRMQDVLAKLGYGDVSATGHLELGTEDFILYDGDGSLSDTDYENFEDILLDTTTLATLDIIFINCSDFGIGDPLTSNTSTKIANLQTYINNGGKIFVTDLSYDFVEQTFPNHIDFDASGDDNGSTAETAGAAENGSSSAVDTNATVSNATMAAWLDVITVNDSNVEDCANTGVNNETGARNDDGSIYIGDFLSSWAVMDDTEPSPDNTVTQWIIGTEVESASTRPLTISFDVGTSGGRVLYSSYHTAESCATTGFWPQERVLQYLVFEL